MMPKLFTACAAILVIAGGAHAQNGPEEMKDPYSADVAIEGHVVEPRPVGNKRASAERLEVPDGFEVGVFAEGLSNPRMLAVAEDGRVYVTERMAGQLRLLEDSNGDGRADMSEVVFNRPMLHGITIEGDTIYLTTVNDVYRATLGANGHLEDVERIIDDLPDGGQHPNRTLAVGPDGKLYISVGSTCNACSEPNPENATILRAEPDGSARTIFASGLRNTIGFGFAPGTGALYGLDHGIDWLGDEVQKEELNRIRQGRQYGWPYVYDDGQLNPQDEPPNEISLAQWAEASEAPVALYTAHAAPMQMAFYTGDQFPADYAEDAFVAMRGSWNRRPPSGFEVVRIRFEDGEPRNFESFLTGFLSSDDNGWVQYGRLAGVAVAADGVLLVSDDENGVIYRVAYTGDAVRAEAADSQNTASADLLADSGKEDLAAEELEAPGTDLPLRSEAFEGGAAIPDKFGAEGENISPPLAWDTGPDGTQSYAIVMEDPDVSEDPPFVHWTIYNIPADHTMLREGVPSTPKLMQPPNVLQGQNDRGATGYYGPRPPAGDPPHHYHFQIFALDQTLDLPPGANRAELVAAMKGHVLAAGELVGTFER